MHRSTPADTLHRAYDGGGTRTCIESVNDKPQMQEFNGNFMSGESRKDLEAPQNYGFTSVVRDATKDGLGKLLECAEGFISFLGGSRSLPILTSQDDRRYRLKELEKGDVAIFDYLQHQFHLNAKGMFLTGRTDKTVKIQLAPPPQDQQSQQSSSGSGKKVKWVEVFNARGEVDGYTEVEVYIDEAGVEQLATGSSGGNGSGSSQSGGNKKLKGQKKRYDQTTNKYLEMTNNTTNLVHDQTINYKTGVHTFSPPDGATARDGNPLVKILGDKFTQGFGTFTKQVSAAMPFLPQHLTTKAYVDALFGSGGGGGGGGGGAVSSATPPMIIDTAGNLTISYQAPLYLNGQTLGVQIASPLMLDANNHLTSSINEAPTDGLAYGRQSSGWHRVLAITNDILDGGNF